MNNQKEMRRRATLIAQKYFEGYEDWPTPVLIEKLETVAYRIAREGDNREATGLFVAVAELSKVQDVQELAKQPPLERVASEVAS